MISQISKASVLAALFGGLFFSSGAAVAQGLPGDCMASFNAKPDRSISFIGWMPGGLQFGETISCPAAEDLRQKLFRGSGITEADLSAAVAAQDALKVERAALAQRAAELRVATTADQLRTIGQVLWTSAVKYRAAYTCLAAETPPGFALCGAFAAALTKQSYTLWKIANEGGVGTERAAAAAELDRQVNALDQAIASGQPARRSLGEAKSLLLQTQIQLCESIKKNCI